METMPMTMDIAQARREAIARVNALPLPKLVQAIDFMDYLKTRAVDMPSGTSEPRGTLEDLLACAGSWQFEPGELEEILQFIEQMRLMELEEPDDFLLD